MDMILNLYYIYFKSIFLIIKISQQVPVAKSVKINYYLYINGFFKRRKPTGIT